MYPSHSLSFLFCLLCVLFVTTLCVIFSIFRYHVESWWKQAALRGGAAGCAKGDCRRPHPRRTWSWVLAIAKRHQLPVRTVQHVIARAKRAGGDPVAPRGHKKRKLNDVEAAKLCKALDQNSIATNRQLRAVVRNKIAARTVSDYLARAHPPFTTKVIQDQEPEELT